MIPVKTTEYIFSEADKHHNPCSAFQKADHQYRSIF